MGDERDRRAVREPAGRCVPGVCDNEWDNEHKRRDAVERGEWRDECDCERA